MKILIVFAKFPDSTTHSNIFVKEQISDLKRNFPDVNFELYNIESNNNKLNYILRRRNFYRYIKENKIDIVHYHYGLSALIGLYQNIKSKQVITFHGDDINLRMHRYFSQLAIKYCDYAIFVNNNLARLVKVKNYSIIPCGCNSNQFKPMDMNECRRYLNLQSEKKIILYVGNKNVPVKNYPLFRKTMEFLKQSFDDFYELELMNVKRDDVPVYLNAADVIVLTSFKEGSPQVIKEAAFCQRPTVTANVGDVPYILEGSNNSHIINSYNPDDFANAIKKALLNKSNTGFIHLQEYDNNLISHRIMTVYNKLI